MPFWPIPMAAAAMLLVWGASRGVWAVPALALSAYIGTRLVMGATPPALHEVAVCSLWLCIASCMMYTRAWVPGFFFTLSALTYPVLLIFGARIGYLAPSSIIGDVFAALGLLSIGGGLAGLSDAAGDPDRSLGWLAAHSLGVAERQG